MYFLEIKFTGNDFDREAEIRKSTNVIVAATATRGIYFTNYNNRRKCMEMWLLLFDYSFALNLYPRLPPLSLYKSATLHQLTRLH